jgi:hypothetical protein
MKIENENIEMNINIKKDKFDNWDIINYAQDYINKYRCEIKELEAVFNRTNEIDIQKDITAKNEILNILETISHYARANEEKALEEIYQVNEKTGMISKVRDIDDKALDEILNYCARNIRILEIIKNRTSEYSNGVYTTCKYIKEIIDIVELEKEGK